MDEIEIDKIRSTAGIFPFMAEVVFFIDSRNRFGLIVWKKQLKKTFFSTYVFFFFGD